MTTITQIQVQRKQFGDAQIVAAPAPSLQDGEALARIERFAITANNVSYALAGDMIGYWSFFPAPDPMGIVPVWGFGEIVESRCEATPVGTRFWGFLPMASHLVVTPTRVSANSFIDGSAHRAALPGLYNLYALTANDPPALADLADERCLVFPLFSTAFILNDYLVDNGFFGAEQVIVSSASSKTGLGLCKLLSRNPDPRPACIGLTSPGNVDFVRSLNACDQIATYDEIAALDASKLTAFVDMAGSFAVIQAVHARFGANLKLSCGVGATHWGETRLGGETAVEHAFFFAPSQFMKRDEDWGPGEAMRRARDESARLARELRGQMTIEHYTGPQAVADVWRSVVANAVSPSVGVMAALA